MTHFFATLALFWGLSQPAVQGAILTPEEMQILMGCRSQCDTYRKEEASSSPSCSKWNRTLPRPKIGRTCTEAFDEAFKSTCVAVCRGREADKGAVIATCTDKRQDMPKPIVGQSCMQGVNGGYEAAIHLFTDAAAQARDERQAEAEREALESAAEGSAAADTEVGESESSPAVEQETVEPEIEPAQQQQQQHEEEVVEAETSSEGLRGSSEVLEPVAAEPGAPPADERRVLATLPVTVDDSGE